MQGFMSAILICSAVISVFALLYMAFTPLLAKRYAAAGLYYAWLFFITGLIIPFRPQFSSAVVRIDITGSSTVPVIPPWKGTPLFSAASNTPPAAFPPIPWQQAAAVIWLAGMVMFLVRHITRHYRFLKITARWSEDITDMYTLALFQSLKSQMGIKQTIALQVCGSIGSPMLTGFVKPRILLPAADLAHDELRFILRHELIHYKRKDLWYKGLVLAAAALHWFNPVVHLMAREINRLCELSCDEEVVRSTDADTRLRYSQTIIGIIRYKSKLETALSTNFYGVKRHMKNRIFSIMDMHSKKAGTAVLLSALLLTMGTGAAWTPDTKAQDLAVSAKETDTITPWISIAMSPDPGIYASYADFGMTVSEDGTKLLFKGQPVRLFEDEQSDTEAFYLDGSGILNLTAVRNAAGEITAIDRISAEKAQEYYDDFFADELAAGVYVR